MSKKEKGSRYASPSSLILKVPGIEIRLRKLGRTLRMDKIHPHKFRYKQRQTAKANDDIFAVANKRQKTHKKSSAFYSFNLLARLEFMCRM